MGPLHGQRGLAHPGRAGDHHDRTFVAGLAEELLQRRQFVFPAGEIPDARGQLRRHGAGRAGRQFRIAAQDLRVQREQFRPRIDAEFVGEATA